MGVERNMTRLEVQDADKDSVPALTSSLAKTHPWSLGVSTWVNSRKELSGIIQCHGNQEGTNGNCC